MVLNVSNIQTGLKPMPEMPGHTDLTRRRVRLRPGVVGGRVRQDESALGGSATSRDRSGDWGEVCDRIRDRKKLVPQFLAHRWHETKCRSSSVALCCGHPGTESRHWFLLSELNPTVLAFAFALSHWGRPTAHLRSAFQY